MNEPKKYTVEIAGKSYVLLSDEPAEYILRSADMVNALINEICTKAKHIDVAKAAVLVALKFASKSINLEKEQFVRLQRQEELIKILDQALDQSSRS